MDNLCPACAADFVDRCTRRPHCLDLAEAERRGRVAGLEIGLQAAARFVEAEAATSAEIAATGTPGTYDRLRAWRMIAGIEAGIAERIRAMRPELVLREGSARIAPACPRRPRPSPFDAILLLPASGAVLALVGEFAWSLSAFAVGGLLELVRARRRR